MVMKILLVFGIVVLLIIMVNDFSFLDDRVEYAKDFCQEKGFDTYNKISGDYFWRSVPDWVSCKNVTSEDKQYDTSVVGGS